MLFSKWASILMNCGFHVLWSQLKTIIRNVVQARIRRLEFVEKSTLTFFSKANGVANSNSKNGFGLQNCELERWDVKNRSSNWNSGGIAMEFQLTPLHGTNMIESGAEQLI
jgi:hypothetical protein